MAATNIGHPSSEAQVIGAMNRIVGPAATVVCAAGGLPGELHKLWRAGRRGPTTWSTAFRAWATKLPVV